MHDPMTLAFSIRNPFVTRKWPDHGTYHSLLVEIWHVDPERDGTDDSCDWFGWKRPLDPQEKALSQAIWNAESVLGNAPYYPNDPAWQAFKRVMDARREWRKRRGRRWHPRWHVHHWRIRFWPVIWVKRLIFDRCSRCGGRFRWREGAVTSWAGDRLEHLWHNPPARAR